MDEKYSLEIAKIRFERATELVVEAEHMLDKDMYKSANNRAYYAIEKAISALLISKQIETKTHSGVLKMFNLEFVRNGDGTFDQEDYVIATEAEHIRNISDYDDFYIASKTETIELVNNSRKLVNKINSVLFNTK